MCDERIGTVIASGKQQFILSNSSYLAYRNVCMIHCDQQETRCHTPEPVMEGEDRVLLKERRAQFLVG